MKRLKKTGLIFFPAFDWAISPTHPEREERLLYTQDQVFEEGLLDFENIVEYKPGLATIEDINRIHICVPDAKSVITESHLISAGGAITAAEKVLTGEVDNAFALVRPPGHHAMRVVHGARGFCNINIEAVMIEHFRRKYGHKRVAVVDTDCHHGDGTQDIYWHDPDTLYISIHQDGRTLYPGSGFPDEFGGPNALGTTINIPLPPETSDEGFLYVLEELILPIIGEFKPDLVINSAGQDNHYTDPITNMRFSAQGYARLNERLEPAHRRARGRLFHRGGPALRQRGDHPRHGGPRLQPRPRTGLSTPNPSASPARSPGTSGRRRRTSSISGRSARASRPGSSRAPSTRGATATSTTTRTASGSSRRRRYGSATTAAASSPSTPWRAREPDLRRHHPEPQLRLMQTRGREALQKHQTRRSWEHTICSCRTGTGMCTS